MLLGLIAVGYMQYLLLKQWDKPFCKAKTTLTGIGLLEQNKTLSDVRF